MAKSFKSLVKKTSTKKSKKMAKKRTKELVDIEREIEWYKIRKPIADAMRILGDHGFEFSGHGFCFGFGGEDFGLINEKTDRYVNFCDKRNSGDKRNSCVVMVNTCKINNPIETLFTGTIGKALNFLKIKAK
jgi:hypothetical protein